VLRAWVMAVAAVPIPPIHMVWDDEHETFDDLRHLGINLEFLGEREREEEEPRPVFRDSHGQRFRILVISLEVVLCVAVPTDYDPLRLELTAIPGDEDVVVAEHLSGEIHRVLKCPTGPGQPSASIASVDLEALSAALRSGDVVQPELSSPDFDDLWFSAVDPAPPIDVGAALRRLMSRVISRWSR